MTPTADKRKQSLYFPEDLIVLIMAEARRQDRSLSWIVQKCVEVGLPEIEKFPAPPVLGGR